MGVLMEKLEGLKYNLVHWEISSFENVLYKIWRLQKAISPTKRSSNNSESWFKLREMKLELDKLLYWQEIMWKLQSLVLWLDDGTRNTKFFHTCASSRRKKNWLRRLKRSKGSWAKGKDQLQTEVVSYFNSLLPLINYNWRQWQKCWKWFDFG